MDKGPPRVFQSCGPKALARACSGRGATTPPGPASPAAADLHPPRLPYSAHCQRDQWASQPPPSSRPGPSLGICHTLIQVSPQAGAPPASPTGGRPLRSRRSAPRRSSRSYTNRCTHHQPASSGGATLSVHRLAMQTRHRARFSVHALVDQWQFRPIWGSSQNNCR